MGICVLYGPYTMRGMYQDVFVSKKKKKIDYRLMTRVQFLAGAFPLYHHIQIVSGAHPVYWSQVY
jgi:hypothetical protein